MEGPSRTGKLRFSFLFALVTMVVGIGGYGYHLYRLAQDWRINQPQPQVERLVKDLRLFQIQTRHFPHDFLEINQRLWHSQPVPNYGRDGRQARTKNYYYYYSNVGDATCAFWALPLGPQRHYASSFFVVLSPGWMRTWKGPALSDAEIAQMPAVPTPAILAELKMQEMPARIFSDSK